MTSASKTRTLRVSHLLRASNTVTSVSPFRGSSAGVILRTYGTRLRDSVNFSTRGKILMIAVLLALTSSIGLGSEAAPQSVFQLSATDITILAPDSEQVIGDGHYKL